MYLSMCHLVLQKHNKMKEVQEEEQVMWKYLKPTDMSEESDDEGTLLTELDRRADTKSRQPILLRRLIPLSHGPVINPGRTRVNTFTCKIESELNPG